MAKRNTLAGQALVEYALILVFVALMVIIVLFATGSGIADNLGRLPFLSSASPAPWRAVLDDFLSRIRNFYDENGRWPRSWKPYSFTDIGLDPADWTRPVEGIYWTPHGSDVGLANKAGDNLQIYVNDLNGNPLHLYDGWSIWCTTNGSCYFHDIAPGNEIDLDSLRVVEED